MVKLIHTWLALIGLLLVSCIPPKAVVVATPPASPKKSQKTAPAVATETALPPIPDDDLRMPSNLLELPGEGEFRTTTPPEAKAGKEAGAVIARPPTDPPRRTKPNDDSNGGQR